jgi:hypothetical protein
MGKSKYQTSEIGYKFYNLLDKVIILEQGLNKK